MTLDIEIPVLRGFLTPGEAKTWKQNTVRTAGEKLFCHHTDMSPGRGDVIFF